MCDTKPLSQKGSTYVNQCDACDSIFLWHNNVMLTYTPEEFASFIEVISGFAFAKCAQVFPDGEERLVIRTPQRFVSLAFARKEWEDLHEALAAAQHLRQVLALISG
ncbi:DUF6686 family protein [Sabulibacter ruber]|uniref:DUF6686 family protein n=1 Tax=Sabulibacter ruber TaxID=2811901 RepID=UPI001A96F21D|nr:DUF6686 family protein [Sabulibacter ruber]